MSKLYVKHSPRFDKRMLARGLGGIISLFGIVILGYILFPLISWQIYISPVFAASDITSPIPKATVLSQATFSSLIQQTSSAMLGVNYYNASNWFPASPAHLETSKNTTETYLLSIPKLKISSAFVSTVDSDLSKHLVNYLGTAIPPHKGNAVIFGHSTLPQLYNPHDYKTIFANAHTLKIGDEFIVNIEGSEYTYKIFDISIVSPEDTSVLAQSYDDSYVTIVTCTPPGTIWKRLILKAKLEKA